MRRMIVPMKKVSLIIMGDQKAEALRKLRKLGILHLEAVEGSGKKLEELKAAKVLLENALFSVSEKKNKNLAQRSIDTAQAIEAAKEIAALDDEKKQCLARRISLNAELDRLSGWGEIDPTDLESLRAKGIDISLYEMPKSEYDSLDEGLKTVSLQKTKNSVKFLLIKSDAESEDDSEVRLKAYRLELPQVSTAELKRSIAELSERIKAIEAQTASFADCADGLKKAIKSCEKEIEFEIYTTGMAAEALSAEGKGSVSVAYFTGYVEEENLSQLKEPAHSNSWGLLVEDPTEEDNVPT
ncbi:MAG: hypothetical protein J6S18_04265, partial [Oscillospiraceae bacterium]|nr:hypothetical protein [Oscillospiraceae bacterium]